MTEKKDRIKKKLDEIGKDDDKKFTELNDIFQKLSDAEDDYSEKVYPTAIQLILKELHDLNVGLRGSYKTLVGLIDDRNKIAQWINQYKEDSEFLMKILDLIEKKIDEFDKFIEKNKSKFDDVDEIRETHGEILDIREWLVNHQKKIQEREEPKLEEKKDLPYIG